MMSHAVFPLLCLFPLLLAGAEDAAEKGRAARKDTAGSAAHENLRVVAFSVVDAEPLVLLSDDAGIQLVPLRFTPDANGRKLLSAAVDAETRELRVLAFIEGKERNITQPLKTMPRVPDKAFNGGISSVPRRGGGFGPESQAGGAAKDGAAAAEGRAKGRGPTDDDRKRYESLSDSGKEAFRERMREMFSDESFRNAPEDERRAKIRAMFDEIHKEDQAPKSKP